MVTDPVDWMWRLRRWLSASILCCRGQATMPEQELNGPDVSAGFEQMDREGMPQRMRSDRLGKARGTMCFFTGVFDGVFRNRSVRVAAWKEPIPRMHGFPIVAQDLQQLSRQHDVAIFLAFALHHADDHPPTIYGSGLQANGLRDA